MLSSGHSVLGHRQPCTSPVFDFPFGKQGLTLSLVNPGVRGEVGSYVSLLPLVRRGAPDTSHLVSDPAYLLCSLRWVGREECSLGLPGYCSDPQASPSPVVWPWHPSWLQLSAAPTARGSRVAGPQPSTWLRGGKHGWLKEG